MIRLALTLLLALHGGLHLIGLRGPSAEGANASSWSPGIAWLFACALLIAAAALVYARLELFVVPTVLGVLLSQVLIVSSWSLAKAGTIPNLLIAVLALLAWSELRFQRTTHEAVDALFSGLGPSVAAVDEAQLAPLPAPVQRWLRASGVVGRPAARTLRLRQRGRIRTSPERPFMEATAEQYFRFDEPSFVWEVRIQRPFPIAGRDSYREGRGHMLITLAGLVPVVDARGPQIDQGTLLRYLGESSWFPSVALSPYIRWRAVDDNRAEATMTYRGVSASALFTFAEDGRFLSLRAQRYLGAGEAAKLEQWLVPARAWGTRGGIHMPVAGDVIWKLAEGDFNYYAWEIVEAEFDVPERYVPHR